VQTARIPFAILIALELAGSTACTPIFQPCLDVPPPADEDDPHVGPCLEVAVDPGEPEDPPLTPCLKVAPPDPPVQPCLTPEPPEPKPDEDPKDEPRVGPCLRVAPPPKEPEMRPCLSMVDPSIERPTKPLPPPSKKSDGTTARADVLEKLADTLPADVLAKLRDRDA